MRRRRAAARACRCRRCARIGLLPRIRLGLRAVAAAWRHPGVRRILRQMAPALLGVSVAQLSIADQHPDRVAPGRRRGLVAVLRRPADGVPDRAARRRARRGADAAARPRRRARGDAAGYSGMLDWGLRLALLLALPCAVALLVFPEAAGRDAVPARRASTRRRRRQDRAGAARLRRRPDRPDRRQDPGARLLRAPGHPHAGDDRRRRARADAGDERCSSCPSSAMPAWRCRSAWARRSTPSGSSSACSAAAGTSRRRAGAASPSRSSFATLALSALLAVGRDQHRLARPAPAATACASRWLAACLARRALRLLRRAARSPDFGRATSRAAPESRTAPCPTRGSKLLR